MKVELSKPCSLNAKKAKTKLLKGTVDLMKEMSKEFSDDDISEAFSFVALGFYIILTEGNGNMEEFFEGTNDSIHEMEEIIAKEEAELKGEK